MRLVGDRRVAPNPLPRAWAVLAPITARTSALFRLRPMTDLPALPPLHSTPRPLKMKQAPLHSFRRPQTGKTVKNSSGAPKATKGRYAPHIGQAPKYGREASPGQDTSNTARGFAYRRGHQH